MSVEGLHTALILDDGRRVPVAPRRIRFEGTRFILIELGPWGAESDCIVVGASMNGLEIGAAPTTLRRRDTLTMALTIGLEIPEYRLPPSASAALVTKDQDQ